MPTLSGSDRALDSVDRFIRVGGEIARMPILAMPEYKTAADGLFEISRKLLAANENLARWLYRWVYFDFKASNAREQFFTLVKDYRSARSGPAFQAMKSPCGDIVYIYDVRIADKIAEMFPLDERAGEEARHSTASASPRQTWLDSSTTWSSEASISSSMT